MHMMMSTDHHEEEIAYWRKHPDLHRVFEEEWRKIPGNELKTEMNFNGQYFKMTEDIIDRVLFKVTMRALPKNKGGFFFGQSTYTKEDIEIDIEQLNQVKTALNRGNTVYYYNSF